MVSLRTKRRSQKNFGEDFCAFSYYEPTQWPRRQSLSGLQPHHFATDIDVIAQNQPADDTSGNHRFLRACALANCGEFVVRPRIEKVLESERAASMRRSTLRQQHRL
jgi:hypothetical protein